MRNLEAEMKRRGIGCNDIGLAIGCSERSARNRVKGAQDFSLPEAIEVRNQFFPGFLLEYLFATGDNDNEAS